MSDLIKDLLVAERFALMRLPFANEATLYLQESAPTQIFSSIAGLADVHGFVMVPFRATKEVPVVVVAPDVCRSVSVDQFASLQSAVGVEPRKVESSDDEFSLYSRTFAKFSEPLVRGGFRKLVLARRHDEPRRVEIAEALSAFARACEAYPRSMVYLARTPETGIWIGATPEILLSGAKSHYVTVALAGTMPHNPDVSDSSLVWSDKNKLEQNVVVEYVRNRIAPMSTVVEEEGPFTSRAGHLCHLKTEFHFCPKMPFSVADIVESLHPTPAVCGIPKEEALDFITANEPVGREYYSGVVGTVGVGGQTDLYVNLRCAKISDSHVSYFAGGGLLAQSDVDAEWRETESKMNTMGCVL